MSVETRPIRPNEGWPICHLNHAVGVTNLLEAPGNALSYYVTGYVLSGGGDADGFHILRRSCLQLVGTSDIFTVSDNAALEPATSDFAVEQWVKIPSTIPTIPNMIHKDDGSDDGYFLELTTGKPKFTIGDGTDVVTVTAANRINDNGWHHILVTVDRDVVQGLLIYVDGILQGTNIITEDLTDVDGVTGGATDLTIKGIATYDWYISATGLYKGTGAVLTAAQAEARYNKRIGKKYFGTETALSAAWNINEGVGTVCYNAKTEAITSTLTGTPLWSPRKAHAHDSIVRNETCGVPFDVDNTLGSVGQFKTGEQVAAGVTVPYSVNFNPAIRIGVNNILSILETDGTFDIVINGYTESK